MFSLNQSKCSPVEHTEKRHLRGSWANSSTADKNLIHQVPTVMNDLLLLTQSSRCTGRNKKLIQGFPCK